MRTDLTEAQIRDLLRRSKGAAEDLTAGLGVWTVTDDNALRSLVGELRRLRDREASVMHMHGLEQAY